MSSDDLPPFSAQPSKQSELISWSWSHHRRCKLLALLWTQCFPSWCDAGPLHSSQKFISCHSGEEVGLGIFYGKMEYYWVMEYYSVIKKNTFESVLMRWMNLEPIIEWSKSERERQILYIICIWDACIWNLERWYWWSYLQGSNGHTDIESRLVDTVEEGEGERNWGSSMETYTSPYVK